MQLHTVGGRLRPARTFKLIATGYLLGTAALFIPLYLLALPSFIASGAFAKLDPEAVGGSTSPLTALAPVLLLPLILAGQSVIFGGLIVFGLWLYQLLRPIQVIDQERPQDR